MDQIIYSDSQSDESDANSKNKRKKAFLNFAEVVGFRITRMCQVTIYGYSRAKPWSQIAPEKMMFVAQGAHKKLRWQNAKLQLQSLNDSWAISNASSTEDAF
ncbi:RNA-directed RNA polymerase lambda-3 [Striga asiatica]|uniref:RNA-directed RNA polymerase lambda-3 n=1 Tax=Striga asiatica TaxID=4170 RepID=A0A5A7QVY0_STRAF|nr:RNA-directed RNA polymerase lambda-3 [Striga asiatica]